MKTLLTILLFSFILFFTSSTDLKCQYENQDAKYARVRIIKKWIKF